MAPVDAELDVWDNVPINVLAVLIVLARVEVKLEAAVLVVEAPIVQVHVLGVVRVVLIAVAVAKVHVPIVQDPVQKGAHLVMVIVY